MSRQKGARVETKDSKFEVVSKEDNNPLPPVDQLERLHSFRPDLVDKVVNKAFEEADLRHKQEIEQNKFFMKETVNNRRTVTAVVFSCLLITLILGLKGLELSALGPCLVPIALVLSRIFGR